VTRAALEHAGDQGTCHLDRGAQVYVQRPVDLLRREAVEPARRGQRRVRDQHVDPPPEHQRRDLGRIAQVGDQRLDAVQVARKLVEQVPFAPAGEDGGTTRVQCAHDCLPDSARRPGHQCRAALQLDRHPYPLRSAKK
jgi:hypothetical protein